MNSRIKYNDDGGIYCIYCKEIINIGEKYIEIEETYCNEKIKKSFHLDCVPIEEE